MKETEFIQQNHDKWLKFEQSLSSDTSTPEEIRTLYTELNNDLSYAETFYEKRKVRYFLNNLTQSIHRKLYKQKKEPFSAILQTWTIDLPLEIYRARKNIFFAFILFVIYAVICAFSTHQDINFANFVLGDYYISMTEENIADGNPLGVYGNTSQGMMFLQITINNIIVSLLCFTGGVLFSFGTHVILFKNAIMVGVFQYFFKLKGLLLPSFLAIWIHGAFEISAIIIASGAGLTLGHGLLFPKSYTRLQSLQMNGMRGVRIMLSLIPFFIIAGFLESFVTRHYLTLTDWQKWLIILFSFSIILFYYVIYPILVARKYPNKVNEEPKVKVLKKIDFVPYKLRKNTDIFQETFQLYFAKFSVFTKAAFKSAVPFILLILIYQIYQHYEGMKKIYFYDWSEQLSILFGNPYGQNFNALSDVIVSIFWLIPITMLALSSFYSLQTDKNNPYTNSSFLRYLKSRFFKMLIAILPIYFLFIVLPYFVLIPLIFIFPLLILAPASVGMGETPSLKYGYELSFKKWTTSFVVSLVLCIITFFFFQPFAFIMSIQEPADVPPVMEDFLDLFTNFMLPVFLEFTDDAVVYTNIIRQIVYLLFFIFLLPLFFISFVLIFYTAKEENEAKGLYLLFEKFGRKNKNIEKPADFE